MQVNVKGVWWGCKYAIQAMRANAADPAKGLQTGGSIINTASFVALLGAATPQLACECDTESLPSHSLFGQILLPRYS